ncbi:M14 family zinc carboxypeptidase [Neorhizobium galegae]|uniref:M14 family zinc carboxypeptidase n=1 Tax=Neorhizobium galegae TaxID=399 RepID=UPI0006223E33|nr:M14 family zinc carboxypeptidase [Neorhizobium galegae]KAB1122931.1 peptidase M14 [Neorhizobium galegae]MCQ1807615.1 peptidase M14 [Neorhizobium galegae]CDZ56876.1 Peptidase M14 carboxypeptidase A [Neorhizobium galegae bv. orientalis]CDZ62421.1 Peptidase M14 carboxypeptidase A [Neorhizobium galegae bv. orientalis]
MTLIHEQQVERTLDTLVARFADAKGAKVEAWVFDDEKSRSKAEATLAAAGVEAKFRSAYKPLLHFLLEEVDLENLSALHVIYPVHKACPKNRFLLEAYPLAGLVGEAGLTFEAGTEDAFYTVTLTEEDGGTEIHKVFAPNRLHTDFIGETLLSPTGWLAVDDATGERVETDYELLFSSAVEAVAAHDWGTKEPYFDELNIAVTLPAEDRRLAVGEEVVSLREALHEDFYFSLLEIFQKKSGRPIGDRGLQPGQIIPEIRPGETVSVRIETRPLWTSEASAELQRLASAVSPVAVAQIRQELAAIKGVAFEARSRTGRAVEARYHAGGDKPVIISGGQHANETTGIVGALRAAQTLSSRPNAHFVISPLENPDGYQVHWRLRTDNPLHMHHAARYTALGDDLEYRSGKELFEKAIRVEAERLSGAKLHVNLHGYPSHEWTRPLSGYVPRTFAMWTVPKGFFLIMRHHAEWTVQAEILIDRVSRHLAAIPGLVAYNAAQIKLFETHAGETGFRIINGFPCLISIDDRHTVPLTLITEYPDETIYGPAFIQGHTAQMETVLSAYDAIQAIEVPSQASGPAV